MLKASMQSGQSGKPSRVLFGKPSRSSQKLSLTLIFTLAAVCNQDVYDGIYRQIIQQALLSHTNNQVTFQRRNNAIEALRSLCQGQVSSYEKQNLNQATLDQARLDQESFSREGLR